jgi:gluconolactonase
VDRRSDDGDHRANLKESDEMREVAGGYGLIEAPVWDEARGLYFSDVLNGGVYLLGLGGEISLVVPKRRGVGGMALHAAGGLVMSGRDLVRVPLTGERGEVVLIPDAVPDAIGFNDLTTDRGGRVFVGSLAFRVFGGDEPKPGHLCRIDLDGSPHIVSDGVMLSNGLGFSPDGARLYHSDSRGEGVRIYDVGSDGAIGSWRLFASLGPGAVADGLKVASDGSVWVADARGGRVAVFGADGAHLRDLSVPLPMVTSLCFGGADLRDLYVVTGSQGGSRENCASVFKTRVDVPGLPLSPARIAL